MPQTYSSELYVFDAPQELGTIADPKKNIFEFGMKPGLVGAFVNFDFSFHDPGDAVLSRMFWQQIGWMKAESYLAENDYLIFATINPELFTPVYEALQRAH